MKLHHGLATLLVTTSALAVAQPAVAEIVHLRMIGTFTIGDRRGEDFLVELRYDTDAPVTDTSGTTTTFRIAGDILTYTIGDRRSDFQAAMMADGVPNYVSTVYNLGPPRAVSEQTGNGRRVTFTDPTGTQGGVSFFYDTTTIPGLSTRLPTFSELALFNGGEVTFGNSRGTFTYFPFAAVPEPATWGMMILGFGAVGAAMRMRRRKVTVTYA